MVARIEYLRLLRPYHIAGTMTIAVRTDGVLQWILPDHLGSTSTTANADGTLNSVIQYTAFGEIRSTQGITPTKYRYTGQLAQAELGLDYYISRWYNPVLGHFTQADTVVPEPGKASAFDRYAYVQNNPLRYNDPSGHKEAGECGDGGGGKCRKNKKIVDPPKPPEPHCKVGDECQTQTPKLTPTLTPFRFEVISIFPIRNTPSPKTRLFPGQTSTPTATQSPTPTPSENQKGIRIEIKNWDEVNKIGLTVDIVGIVADYVAATTIVEAPQIAVIAEGVGMGVETVDLAYSSYKVISEDPSSLISNRLTNITKKLIETMDRKVYKIYPFIGSISSAFSIYDNLQPRIVPE